jgi:hypothetical protein
VRASWCTDDGKQRIYAGRTPGNEVFLRVRERMRVEGLAPEVASAFLGPELAREMGQALIELADAIEAKSGARP